MFSKKGKSEEEKSGNKRKELQYGREALRLEFVNKRGICHEFTR